MADTQQPVNSPFSKYTKIEMKQSSRGYIWWIGGVILAAIVIGVIFFWGRGI